MGSKWEIPSLSTIPPPSSNTGGNQGAPDNFTGNPPSTARRVGATDRGNLEVSAAGGRAESEAVTDGRLAKRRNG